MNDKINIALIYGSAREGRFCDTVANWAVAGITARDEFELDLVDPSALRQEKGRINSADLLALKRRLGSADAFIVVTPEYNHSYPAVLKLLIDSVYQEWQAKPVGFISYGGISGGLRAVEQLRLVFAELHTVTLRDSVSFTNAWEQFDADGQLHQPERAQKALSNLLTRLNWWATALRNARTGTPYASRAA